MGWLRRVDRFLLAIVTAAVVASLLPARGAAVEALDWLIKIAVAVLFFVYGVGLSPEQALAAHVFASSRTSALAQTWVGGACLVHEGRRAGRELAQLRFLRAREKLLADR